MISFCVIFFYLFFGNFYFFKIVFDELFSFIEPTSRAANDLVLDRFQTMVIPTKGSHLFNKMFEQIKNKTTKNFEAFQDSIQSDRMSGTGCIFAKLWNKKSLNFILNFREKFSIKKIWASIFGFFWFLKFLFLHFFIFCFVF